MVYGVRVSSSDGVLLAYRANTTPIPTGKGRGGSRTAPTCTPYFVRGLDFDGPLSLHFFPTLLYFKHDVL